MSEYMLSISEVQKEITRLPDQFTEELQSIIVTRYGKPVLSILPYETHKALLQNQQSFKDEIAELKARVETLEETLEILRDEKLIKAIHQSVQDIADGKGELLDDVLKELGWE